jgi:hypothetical protein
MQDMLGQQHRGLSHHSLVLAKRRRRLAHHAPHELAANHGLRASKVFVGGHFQLHGSLPTTMPSSEDGIKGLFPQESDSFRGSHFFRPTPTLSERIGQLANTATLEAW